MNRYRRYEYKKLLDLMKLRAEIFNCSYHSVWDKWLTVEEKNRFTKEEVFGK